MLDMKRTGRKISELRKEHNMTQMELADKLGISFQAVSNWERGNTMPDISKLPELARIFGVTTDEMLGESSPLLDSAVKGEIAEYIENNPVTAEEFAQAVPLLKPAQADTGFEKITDKKPLPDITEIEDILPFISQSILDGLALKYADLQKWETVADMAPFLSKNRLNQWALQLADSSGIEALEKIAPFVDTQAMDQAALTLVEKGEDIGSIAFSVDKQVMGKIGEILVEKGNYKDAEALLIFMGKDAVDRLAKSVYRTRGIKKVQGFMPFMSQDAKKEIAQCEYDQHGLKDVADIAPFLDKGFLSGMAQKAIEEKGMKAISPIVPFLDKETLSEFIGRKYL